MIARHLLLLLLALPVALNAQVLPPEIRIEAAAAIGSRSLVVWGSTRLVADTIAPVLYWQMIDGAAPIGDPLPLADSTFAPTTYLQIIPFDRHFLILWNDRKYDSLTTWSTRIDTGGATETPALFADTAVRPQGVFRFDKPDGYTLLWNRWKDSTTARIVGTYVSFDGQRRGEMIEIGEGWMSGIDTNVGAEGLRLIDRGAMAPLTVDAIGRVSELPLLQQAVLESAQSWYRASDGSIWAVRNRVLVNYRSIIDSTLLTTDSLPIPSKKTSSSVFGDRETVPRSTIVVANDMGEKLIYYFRHEVRCCGVGGGWASSDLQRLRSIPDSGWVEEYHSVAKAPFRWFISHKEQAWLIAATGDLFRFGPQCYLSNQTTAVHYFKYESEPTPDQDYNFSVDMSGFFAMDTAFWYGGWDRTLLPSNADLLDLHCPAPRESGSILLNRTSSTTDTRIAVTRDMVVTTLTAPAIFSTTEVAQSDRAAESMIASVIARDGVIEVEFVEPTIAEGRIEVWDLLGRRIAMSAIESRSTRDMVITGNANAGAYIMRITHDGEIEDRIIFLNR